MFTYFSLQINGQLFIRLLFHRDWVQSFYTVKWFEPGVAGRRQTPNSEERRTARDAGRRFIFGSVHIRPWPFLNRGAQGHLKADINVVWRSKFFKSGRTVTDPFVRSRMDSEIGVRTVKICRERTEPGEVHPAPLDQKFRFWTEGRG